MHYLSSFWAVMYSSRAFWIWSFPVFCASCRCLLFSFLGLSECFSSFWFFFVVAIVIFFTLTVFLWFGLSYPGVLCSFLVVFCYTSWLFLCCTPSIPLCCWFWVISIVLLVLRLLVIVVVMVLWSLSTLPFILYMPISSTVISSMLLSYSFETSM